MLDKLPLEVILAISSFLSLNDKLILITTCQRFFNLISTTSLFSQLDLLEYKENIATIINKFKTGSSLGAQVKLLSIDITRVSDKLLFQLPTVFPNITRITTRKHMPYFVGFQDDYSKCPLLEWSRTLEIYNVRYDWPEALPVLKTTSFPRLTELVLGVPYSFGDKKEGFDIPYFIPHIKNTPSLKKLTLWSCALNLEFLEEIHSSCPHLESLCLDQTHIVITNHTLMQPIIPADSFFCLHVNNAFCFDKHGLFLDYITTKYRHLKQLTLSFEVDYGSSDFENYYNEVSISGFSESDFESDVENEDMVKIQEYLRIYNSLKEDLESAMAVYGESGSKFFSNLTTSTKSIAIQVDIFSNMMEAIGNSNIEPSSLTFLLTMENPMDIHYISNIKTLKTLELETRLPEQVYNHSIYLSSITRLNFAIQSDIAYTDWLLAMFPSLEELCVAGPKLLTREKIECCPITTFPNLSNLDIRVDSVDQACFDCLKMIVPNINVLKLQVNGSERMDAVDIDISEWNLIQLNLVLGERLADISFYFKIKTQNVTKILKYHRSEQSLAVVKSRSYFDSHKKPGVVTIISSSGKFFKFNGFLISLLNDNITIIS